MLTFFCRWNSAVFLTDKHVPSPFSVFIVTEDLLGETTVNCSTMVQSEPTVFNTSSVTYTYSPPPTANLSSLGVCPGIQALLDQYHEQRLIKMDKTACQENYKQGWGNDEPLWETDVLTVTESTWNRTILGWFEPVDNTWICNEDESCDLANLPLNDTWLLGLERVPIDYCLVSPPLEPNCQVQFSALVMSAVIICNAVKFCCVIIAMRSEHEELLATVGGTVTSFL